MSGSLVNHLQGDCTLQPVPVVGMGATLLGWTDRHAATVVGIETLVQEGGKVKKGEILIRRDRAVRIDKNGMSESQTYEYSEDTAAPTVAYTFRKNGSWVRKGDTLKGGQRVALGHRDEYHDFSF